MRGWLLFIPAGLLVYAWARFVWGMLCFNVFPGGGGAFSWLVFSTVGTFSAYYLGLATATTVGVY